MEHFDVVIVGASFAGLTLAKHLPVSLNILVVDAKPEVGATVESTGLITTNTRNEFASFLDIDKFITNPISTICVVAPDFDRSFFSSTTEPWIHQTDTKMLVKNMADILPPNVTLRTKTAFAGVMEKNNEKIITLISSGKKYEVGASFLVGADGAQSFVASSIIGLDKNKSFLYGYERVYFGNVLLGNSPSATIYHFWFGEFSLGYGGWLSPTIIDGRPAIRLGLAKLMKDRADAGKLTDRFVAMLVEKKIIAITDEPPSYVFGSLIPIGGALKKTYQNNTLLIGNAAGYCGAFAADGIKGAVIAGKEAAPLIAMHLVGEEFSLSKFSKAVNRHDWILDYYHRQLRYRWAWNMMKRDRTFAALWNVIEKEKESFLHQFCDSKDKRRSLAWTVIKINNFPRLVRFAFYLALDAITGRGEDIK